MSERRIPSFKEAVDFCIGNEEFMQNYSRLRGCKTLIKKPPTNALEQMIDNATGYQSTVDQKEAFELFEFIRDYVWAPVVAQILDGK